jgi:cobalt-zinc-cadmium efflux system outer membrane protein
MSFAVCGAIAQTYAPGPSASGVLTEAQAVTRALTRAPFDELLNQRIAVAQSAVARAGTLPNPGFDVERDRVGEPLGTATDTKYRLSQRFDIAGRRALARDAAEQRVVATRSDAAASRLALTADVRRAFAEALLRAAERDALMQWDRRLDRAAATVRELRRMGEASGYDLRRIEQERIAARARTMAAEAEYARAWERVLGVIGAVPGAGALRPVGPLLPPAAPLPQGIETAVAARPDLRSLAVRADAFDREREAARRGWIPDVTLTVGARDISGPEQSGNGLILGVALPIPVFDRNQPELQRADAEARALRAERELLLQATLADLRGRQQQAEGLRAAAVAFRAESAAGATELARIAETAYRGGETGILQLVDAYRTVLEAETTALELEHRARVARIELDAALGALPNE